MTQKRQSERYGNLKNEIDRIAIHGSNEFKLRHFVNHQLKFDFTDLGIM